MSFTNQTLSILGTAAGIATAADHLNKQSAQIEETKESNKKVKKISEIKKEATRSINSAQIRKCDEKLKSIDNIISNSLEKNSVNIYKNTNFNKLINFYNFDDGIYYLYERTRKTINEELNDKNSIYFGISYNESLESLKYLLIKNINIIYEKNKNRKKI